MITVHIRNIYFDVALLNDTNVTFFSGPSYFLVTIGVQQDTKSPDFGADHRTMG